MATYVLGFVFYGPLAMAILLPFDLPHGHVAYYVIYALATAASLAWIHRSLKRMLNGCYFTLTPDALALGNEPVSPLSNFQGFDRFFERLLQLRKPVWRESATFTPADLAALQSRRINKLQPPTVE